MQRAIGLDQVRMACWVPVSHLVNLVRDTLSIVAGQPFHDYMRINWWSLRLDLAKRASKSISTRPLGIQQSFNINNVSGSVSCRIKRNRCSVFHATFSNKNLQITPDRAGQGWWQQDQLVLSCSMCKERDRWFLFVLNMQQPKKGIIQCHWPKC